MIINKTNFIKKRRVLLAVIVVLLGYFIVVPVLTYESSIEKDLKPINESIEKIGAKKVCSYLSQGDRFTDSKPYYYKYYSISDNPQLTRNIKSIAQQSGYNLKPDTGRMDELKKRIDEENSTFDTTKNLSPDGESFSDKTDYLESSVNKKSLAVQIHRDDITSLQCIDGAQYGVKRVSRGNEVTLFIGINYLD
ncbi:MAG: hypothetical protein QFB86_02635 [Patescibacteria group bacterium]|nr:hypothetical protein [Patescibacteria group bacterium]